MLLMRPFRSKPSEQIPAQENPHSLDADALVRREREHEKLLKAKELAESKAKARMDYFATLSHEIRTPLNGVLGMLQLLRETALNPDQQDYIETALGSGDCLLDLIENVLDLSRLESDELEVESLSFDVRSLVKDVVGLYGTQGSRKGLKLNTWVPEDIPQWLEGDPLRIRQILNNLVSNSIKFTSRGEIGISLNLEASDQTDVSLSFFVRDTGIGIEEEKQKRIFEAFSQAEAGTARRYGGSGLGLAICRKLAERMGGQMSLLSAPGEGSCFGLHLPLRIAFESEQDSVKTVEDEIQSQLGGLRVLVADDDRVNRKVSAGMLEKLGCFVTLVTNGEEAVTAWENSPFDFVLMDCEMPLLSGIDAARKIRLLEAGTSARIPILAFTGHVLPHEQQRCKDAGMDDCISKPITLAGLRQTMANHLLST